jgi:predicted SpoU family rRNA methylase
MFDQVEARFAGGSRVHLIFIGADLQEVTEQILQVDY